MSKKSKGTSGTDVPGSDETQHAQIAAIGDSTSPEAVEKLLREVADLRKQLALAEERRSDAEKAALAAAEAQGMLMQREIQEVATGNYVTVLRATKEDGSPNYKARAWRDDGRPIMEPIWRKVKLPTYFYKIDMPAVGGMAIRLGEAEYYHGVTYEFDRDTLATIKEMVYRLWDHERSIHGSDENFYRPKQAPTFNFRTGQRLR